MGANHLTLAVAGSGKTQELIDHCASLPHQRRALVVTYTQANQAEISARLSSASGSRVRIGVVGWFTFLIREFARPFVRFKFPDERVLGFNFDGRPHRYAKGKARFLDSSGSVYREELPRLAYDLVAASKGALLRRLECCYDELLIDEVQDLAGYDWEILDALFGSSIEVRLVGDIRQSVLSTNARGKKNKQYAYAQAIDWFREREDAGTLAVHEKNETWRCRPEIAAFSDSIFEDAWGFPETKSKNTASTGHDGIFLVHADDVSAYVERFAPQCLRHSVSSGKSFDLDFLNFRAAKGTSHERVLIVPTKGIRDFVASGIPLSPIPAAALYVATTRARQSVAIVIDKPGGSTIPYWVPE